MLSEHITRYVAIYRQLGLKFSEASRTLHLYARYAEGYGDTHMFVSRIHDWCATGSTPVRARSAYDVVRRFCVFMNAEDDRHEVPPAGAFGRGKRPRPAPHLLTPDQIEAIMDATLDLPGLIAPHTYRCLFGLLAATGLRISEALALQCEDISPDGLVIRNGKFGKSRLLPIHTSTRQALSDYMAVRSHLPHKTSDLFQSRLGRAPNKVTAHIVFVRIARRLGFRPNEVHTPGPRLHDLRHTFAVRSLEACPHDRTAVANHIAALSTYLGHTDVTNTYWYLEATPVLMHAIAAASEGLFAEAAL